MIYYHVSEDEKLPNCLIPRVPKNAYSYEPKIRRICVSPSILGCIRDRYSHSSYRNTKLYIMKVDMLLEALTRMAMLGNKLVDNNKKEQK